MDMVYMLNVVLGMSTFYILVHLDNVYGVYLNFAIMKSWKEKGSWEIFCAWDARL